MRRAELLALRAAPELIETLLDTRLAESLDAGEFWRESFYWFIRHWDALGWRQDRGDPRVYRSPAL